MHDYCGNWTGGSSHTRAPRGSCPAGWRPRYTNLVRAGKCRRLHFSPAIRRLRQFPMQIRVLFFGMLKDLLGRSSDTLDLPEGARVADVLSHYIRLAPSLQAMLPALALSVNQ